MIFLWFTDTGENVQKWTRVFSTRRWVILVARTRRKKEKKIACPLLDVFACWKVSSPRLYRLRFIIFNFIFDFWQSVIVSDRRTILFLLISGPQRYPWNATNQNLLLINCTCGLDLPPRALLKSQEVYKFVPALILPPT